MNNFKRFLLCYVILTIISRILEGGLTEYILVSNIGMAAFCCFLGDIITWLTTPSTKKGE